MTIDPDTLNMAKVYDLSESRLLDAIGQYERDEAFRTALHALRNATRNAAIIARALLAAQGEIERMRAVVEAAESARGILLDMRRVWPPPDSWFANATCRGTFEMSVSQWNRMERLRCAIDTYRKGEQP